MSRECLGTAKLVIRVVATFEVGIGTSSVGRILGAHRYGSGQERCGRSTLGPCRAAALAGVLLLEVTQNSRHETSSPQAVSIEVSISAQYWHGTYYKLDTIRVLDDLDQCLILICYFLKFSSS